jgi:hypothetical protein
VEANGAKQDAQGRTLMAYTLTFEQSSDARYSKKPFSALGSTVRRYAMSLSVNLNVLIMASASSRPAKTVYSPWNGFLRKNRSNTA